MSKLKVRKYTGVQRNVAMLWKSEYRFTLLYPLFSHCLRLTSSEVLSNIKSTTEYLSHLTLVTGSENKHIRQYALDSGALIDDQLSDYAPTCVAGTTLKHQYFGTKDGVVLYDPKNKSIRRMNQFQVSQSFWNTLAIPEAKNPLFAGWWGDLYEDYFDPW